LMVLGEEGMGKVLRRYEAAGGRGGPRLAHHIAERRAFGAVTYALFALDSGNEEYLAAAKAQLAAAE
ncbi:Mph(A) family macrolide 2'-phosphotransferase, partial [Klebsiella pneumoniae]